MARPKRRTVPLAELVFDFDLYPRTKIDSAHVAALAEALRAGAELPPLTVEAGSMRIIDGFHRARAYRTVEGDGAKVPIQEVQYGSECEAFLAAVRANAAHGRHFSTQDRVHAALLADKLGIDEEAVATALNMRPERLGELKIDRTAIAAGSNLHVPLKRTIRHMAGRRLTKSQQEAQRHLGGMNQLFYVNQLIWLVRENLLDKENERLMEALRELHGLLDGLLATA